MRPWLAPLASAALAIVLRLLYLSQSADNPSFLAPVVDAQSYDSLAREIASGAELPARLFYQGSFYPLFLSGVYALSDASIVVAKCLQMAIGAGTCALTAILGRRLFGERVGFAAGVVTALNAPLIFFEGELLATGWSAFWSVALLLAVLWADESESRGRAAIFALVGALACLTRPTFLPIFLLAGGWLTMRVTARLKTRGQRLAWLGALAAGFASLALPFVALNHSVTGRYGLLPHSGGLNLYIGNNPNREETISTRPADFYKIGDLPTHHGVRAVSERQSFYTRRVVDYAIADPVGLAAGLFAKTLEFASPRELPRNVDIYVFGQWSVLLRTLVWKVGPWGFPNGLLFPLALLGLSLCWRTLPGPVKAFPILYAAAIIGVFVAARYRVALAPITALLACAAVAALIQDWSEQRRLRVVGLLALAGLFSTLSALPGPFAQERGDYLTELHYSVATSQSDRAAVLRGNGSEDAALQQEQLARQQFQLTLERDPTHAPALANLGVLAFRDKDYESADQHFRAALRIEPAQRTALEGRAQTLRAMGRSIEAQSHMLRATELLEAQRQEALRR